MKSGAIFVGIVAFAHVRVVCAQVQRVRRAGASGWVHHRASDGAADSSHVGEATSAPSIAPARAPPLEMEFAQRLATLDAVFEAIAELEFDQTADSDGASMHYPYMHATDLGAEPCASLD